MISTAHETRRIRDNHCHYEPRGRIRKPARKMNEGSAEQLRVGERAPRAPSRTVPLNPAKLQQLSPRWAEDAVVSGRLIPEGQGLFPRAPLCCSPPKSSFRGGLSSTEGKLKAGYEQLLLVGPSQQAHEERGHETTSSHPRRLSVTLSHEPVAFPVAHQSKIFPPVTRGPHKAAEG